MKAVAIDFFGDIDGVVDGALAVDDRVVEHDAVAESKGVHGVV